MWSKLSYCQYKTWWGKKQEPRRNFVRVDSTRTGIQIWWPITIGKALKSNEWYDKTIPTCFSLTDKHLKYYFKHPDKKKQIMKTKQVRLHPNGIAIVCLVNLWHSSNSWEKISFPFLSICAKSVLQAGKLTNCCLSFIIFLTSCYSIVIEKGYISRIRFVFLCSLVSKGCNQISPKLSGKTFGISGFPLIFPKIEF